MQKVPPLTMRWTFPILCCLSAAIAWSGAAMAQNPELIEVRRIWDKAPHNAFTDLLFRDGRWFCVFREGSKHVSPDGSIRVITSTDGDEWTSLALISHPTDDLRDAKISVTPDGRFMLNGAGMQADKPIRYHSMSWFSPDGKTWDEGRRIGDPGFWLWRSQWHNGMAYSMGYATNRDRTTRTLRFYRSADGITYEPWIEKVNVPNGVGEDRILFQKDGTALCLLRHETGTKQGLLGTSVAPYKEWTWKELNLRIGGPNMIELPDGRILAATRLYAPKTRTSLSWLDVEAGTLTECLTLPSGGDTSYPGMVLHNGILWVSYYSSHEEKTCIYLAKVKF
ncbi:MAG: sialidase family protein [Planctomycetaceae bacterium]